MKPTIKFSGKNGDFHITTNGEGVHLNGVALTDANSVLGAYLIGSIYLSVNNTSPASLFGGDWERIAEGRALFGAGTLNNITYTANTTKDAGLPNIQGSIGKNTSGTNGFYYNTNFEGAFSISTTTNADRPPYNSSGGGGILSFDASKSNSIYGNSDTVQPNAFVVYMWKRIS